MTAQINKFKKAQQSPACRQAGFTLVELLVVIAVLGVLAASVLIAINPLEQLARARDAGRQSTVSQLGKAVQAYYTANNAVYPVGNTSWLTTLQGSSDIKTVPPENQVSGVTASCASGFKQNGWCYYTAVVASGPEALVYSVSESKSLLSKCPANTPAAYIVWSSYEGKTGVTCVLPTTAGPQAFLP